MNTVTYPTEDHNGHCLTVEEVSMLKHALNILNASETIGRMEENANYHHASEWRQEMINRLHVAVVDESAWTDDPDFPENECLVCGRIVS